jgi:hypothetical protein
VKRGRGEKGFWRREEEGRTIEGRHTSLRAHFVKEGAPSVRAHHWSEGAPSCGEEGCKGSSKNEGADFNIDCSKEKGRKSQGGHALQGET